MESVAREVFSDIKGSELIFSTRAVMIPVSRNYEEKKTSQRRPKGNVEPLSFRRGWTFIFTRSVGAMLN